MRAFNSVCVVLLSLCLGLSLAAPAPAYAQAQQDDEDTDERARTLYMEGEAHYAAGRYEEAAESFLEAFNLSGRTALLFNLGNAYERMGDYERAAEYLRRYVDSPRARDVVSVRERVRRLEAAAERKRREAAEAEERREAAEAAAANAVASSDDDGSEEAAGPDRSGYWWLLGSGGAAVGTIAFGLAARQAGNEAAALCSETSEGRPLCDDEASSALSRETAFAIGADVGAIVTLVMAGVGTYLILSADDSSAERPAAEARFAPRIVPTWSTNSAGLSLQGHF
ncbi:Tetratricopeptide TPR_4 [Haliangium ochraceum DSM 14365]|uniref:Tetratricopeptide TPR_4 n=1 Tax=Haliangium ochraceum (strain DSM 14365 / JCM 11303 / SMP-2) TaxID=502025 RepID=D0LQB1_HALO1|nr:Tetratricopeptide TPR_4 [Haliangium ochraceum DSM 14365]